MELLQLRYFMESAQRGSFAATAEQYIVPATSVSAAVRRLEQELGCQLFDRTSNRITLNENGVRLLQKSFPDWTAPSAPCRKRKTPGRFACWCALCDGTSPTTL